MDNRDYLAMNKNEGKTNFYTAVIRSKWFRYFTLLPLGYYFVWVSQPEDITLKLGIQIVLFWTVVPWLFKKINK